MNGRTSVAYKELTTYAQHVGIRFRPGPLRQTEPIWNGDTCQQLPTTSDLAHEIAHWHLAGPDRRHLINYGYGGDYQWSECDTYPEIADIDIGNEELRASVLGILLEHAANSTWIDTWEFHSWAGEFTPDELNEHNTTWDDPCPQHQAQTKDIRCSRCVTEAFDSIAHEPEIVRHLKHYTAWQTSQQAPRRPRTRR